MRSEVVLTFFMAREMATVLKARCSFLRPSALRAPSASANSASLLELRALL